MSHHSSLCVNVLCGATWCATLCCVLGNGVRCHTGHAGE